MESLEKPDSRGADILEELAPTGRMRVVRSWEVSWPKNVAF